MEHRGLGSWLVDRPDTHGRQDLSHIARAPKNSCSFLNYLPKYFVILGDCPVASGWWRVADCGATLPLVDICAEQGD